MRARPLQLSVKYVQVMRRRGTAVRGCAVNTVLLRACSFRYVYHGDVAHCVQTVCRWGSCACCAGSGTSSPWARTRCWTSRSAASRSAASPSGCGGTSCATCLEWARHRQHKSGQSNHRASPCRHTPCKSSLTATLPKSSVQPSVCVLMLSMCRQVGGRVALGQRPRSCGPFQGLPSDSQRPAGVRLVHGQQLRQQAQR